MVPAQWAKGQEPAEDSAIANRSRLKKFCPKRSKESFCWKIKERLSKSWPSWTNNFLADKKALDEQFYLWNN